ncbi:uncharacterized protein LOC133038720 [Cannabis sativa]|uniref:uncharacterized protein LOC133038720 n=1 Tax=Cannabis sativa TaxID=3483 RepID=UPI0029C9E089|nr:uncharacterized protein LOC133038720 [Cannabis sativa]XP_060972902.1 uncharacterized protein LOC133038720 [Cannabis sativa]XP_060972903.1 uncharacterized protein LOC133038720 [Cannabis sativa]
MGRTRLPDKAWNYCTMVDGKSCHVCCIFCGHTMWGGVSRLKEHLAQKRGDVAECKRCPANVTMEMQEHLIQVSLEKENKQKRKREMLEDMRKKKGQCHSSPQPPPPPPPPQGEVVEEMDEKEKALLDEAIKESLQTHKMEEMKERNEEADLARACLESVQLYEQELLMRQNGSSSRYDYDETDFDIDMNF